MAADITGTRRTDAAPTTRLTVSLGMAGLKRVSVAARLAIGSD